MRKGRDREEVERGGRMLMNRRNRVKADVEGRLLKKGKNRGTV